MQTATVKDAQNIIRDKSQHTQESAEFLSEYQKMKNTSTHIQSACGSCYVYCFPTQNDPLSKKLHINTRKTKTPIWTSIHLAL
mmetsp:Transcript_1481/g.2391  ORF Transcript_1481/g.2391 Transcript_1481/m.2391 type:complete len:83 (+) Transcript_1481:294-542(+)